MSTHSNNRCNEVRKIIKKKIKHYHKGDAGRICIIGGSKDYTGAPYLSAMSSIYTGADLCYIWTYNEAAIVIKSYSPDLIVSPILDNFITIPINDLKIKLLLMDCIIIGPGLGRSDSTAKIVRLVVELSVQLNKPLVLDADSLYFFAYYKDILVNYNRCVLTPNHREIKYLLQDEVKDGAYYENYIVKPDIVDRLKDKLPNNTIICKGRQDVIVNSQVTKYCSLQGSAKRAGGQGDILCGIIATFFTWVVKSHGVITDNNLITTANIAYEGCRLMRKSAKGAWIKRMRGMVASDILNFIPPKFNQLYSKNLVKKSIVT